MISPGIFFSQASVWGSGRAGSCHCVQHREPGWVCEKWRNRTFLRLNRFQSDLTSLCFSTVVYQCVTANFLFHSGIPLLCVIYRIPSNRPSCNDTQYSNPMTAKQLMAGVEILRQSSQSNADSLSCHNSHHSESESLSLLTKSNLPQLGMPDLTTSLSRYLPSFLLKVCVDLEQIGNFCFLIFATESTWYPTLRYHHSWYRTCKRKHTLQWTFFLEARSAGGKERLLVKQDFTAAS